MTLGDGHLADDDLQRLVSDELFSDPNIAIGAVITVVAQSGEVTLRGTVGSFGEKREARDAAQRVDGVTSVKDELNVLGPTDADLRSAVREALRLDSRIPTTIDVASHEGVVTLTGTVGRKHQRDAAVFIAGNVPGVVEVEDRIDIEGEPDSSGDAEEPEAEALIEIASPDAKGRALRRAGSRGELDARLEAAALRIERLRAESEAAGNVVHFRMTRHVQSLQSDAIDAHARLAELTDDRSYDERLLERDVSSLEVEVAVAEAKLDAARAEAGEDPRGDIEGEIRAMKVEASAIKARFDLAFGRKRQPPPPDR